MCDRALRSYDVATLGTCIHAMCFDGIDVCVVLTNRGCQVCVVDPLSLC